MELRLERTAHTATVHQTPVTLWSVRAGDDTELGLAFVAEIVAVPDVTSLEPAQVRRLLALELLGDPWPTIWVQPTQRLVESNGAPARLWLGRSGGGLTIGAFICTIAPTDASFADLLGTELRPLPVETETDAAMPSPDPWRLYCDEAALR